MRLEVIALKSFSPSVNLNLQKSLLIVEKISLKKSRQDLFKKAARISKMDKGTYQFRPFLFLDDEIVSDQNSK